METTVKLLRYLVVVVIVAILGGVAGWFFFVRSNQGAVSEVAGNGGSEEQTPLFDDEMGSSAVDVRTSTEEAAAAPAGPRSIERLWRADRGPVAGYSFIAQKKNATSSIHLYFIERANGNVFDADAVEQTTMRLTNTLIPKVYEAVVAPTGGSALLRSLDGEVITTLLASFATPASTTTFPQALVGTTLPADIRSIAIDPDPKTGLLFYLEPGTAGGVVGMLSSIADAKPQQLFSSPLESWRAQFAGGKVILLLSPADDMPGYAYTLSSGGALSLLAGPTFGLMILPHPSQEALLYSSSSGGRLSLYAQVGKDAPTQLSVQTVAEKCVWAPNSTSIVYCAVPRAVPRNGFINAWYRGSLHTSDTWWQIDLQNGTAEELFTPTTPLDVHDPRIDPSGSYIAFTNGVDLSLWVLRIVQ